MHRQQTIAIFVLLLSCAALCGQASAATFIQVEKSCPYDGTTVKQTVSASGTSYGTMLDYRPYGPIVSPSVLVECPGTGFVFFKNDFSDAEFERLRPFVLSDEFRSLRGETQHYRASWLIGKFGEPRANIVSALLRATWQAPDIDRYKRYAAELIGLLDIELQGPLDTDEIAERNLLATELLRRGGDFGSAKLRLDAALLAAEEDTVLHRIGLYQKQLIEKRDSFPYPVPRDIFGGAKLSRAWFEKRTPKASSQNSLLGELLARFQTRWFKWGADSSAIVSADDGKFLVRNIDDGTVREMPMREQFRLPIAELPNGHLLVRPNAQPKPPQTSRPLLTLNEKTFDVISELQLPPELYDGLTDSSVRMAYEGKYLFYRIVRSRRLTAINVEKNELEQFEAPDGEYYVSAADRTRPWLLLLSSRPKSMMIWDFREGRTIWSAPIPDSQDYFLSAVFSADQEKLYYVIRDLDEKRNMRACHLIAASAKSGQQIARWSIETTLPQQSISLSSNKVAAQCGHVLAILTPDLSAAEIISNEPIGQSPLNEAQFSPDERKIAIKIDGVVTIFNVRH